MASHAMNPDRRSRWRAYAPLIALVVAYSILVGMHTALTPLFEAPDEVWHYAYVRWLAQGNGLPPLDEDRSGAYQEAAQPPLYYGLAALINSPFDDGNLPELMWHNPGFGYQAPGTARDNKNMLIHTSAEAFPWQGTALAVHATRVSSWLFGLLTVLAATALGHEVFRRPVPSLTVAAIVAFHPQFVFMSSVVSNDSAAAAVATVGLWLAARMLRRGPTWRTTIFAGATAGIGALTKTSVLPLIPALAGCLVVGTLCARRQANPRHIGLQVSTFLALVLAIGGWWYVRNVLLYGDPLGLSAHTQTPWGRDELAALPELISELPLLWRSFWGAYGWGHVFWHDSIYVLLSTLSVPLLLVSILAILREWSRVVMGESFLAGDSDRHAAPSWLLTATLAAGWCAVIFAALLHWMRQVEAPHGRLLFPAIGAWACLLVLGLVRIGRSARALAHRLRYALLMVLTIVSALAPTHRILATFAPPRSVSPTSIVAGCQQPQDLVYDDRIRLLCLETPPHRASPGADVAVEACWATSRVVQDDYTVYLHLLGPGMQRYAERHTYPGLGSYPTSLWQPGEAFCETYHMIIEPWVDTPVRAQVEIGLYDASTGARAPVATDGGQEIAVPVGGHIDIVGVSQDDASSVDRPLATLGRVDAPLAQLVTSDQPGHASPGEEIEVAIDWLALDSTEQDYVAFVHVWRPGDTQPLAQSDAQPRGGWYPTSAWRRGDRVPDRHTLRLPATAQPGTYPLWAGLYRVADGTRLPAYGVGARYPNDLVPLGILRIR